MKIILLALFLGLGLISGCGQKSTVTAQVEARKLAEAYGDGEHVIIPIAVPLSDELISSFDSPLEKVNFIIRGFAKMFLNLGAGMGMGKMQLSIIQPIPEISKEFIHGVKIKRLFFYIEPKEGETRRRTFWQRYLDGKDNINFNFLEKMALQVSPYTFENQISWMPIIKTTTLSKREFSPLERLFEDKEKLHNKSYDATQLEKVTLVQYSKESPDFYLRNQDYGKIFLINTKKPMDAKHFLERHPDLKGFFKRIHVLNDSLLVELIKDPIIEESFKTILEEDHEKLDKVGITFIDSCTSQTCLDLSLPNVNLVPMLTKSNGLRINAFIDAGRVPDSFQLKGFVEFEVKLKFDF